MSTDTAATGTTGPAYSLGDWYVVHTYAGYENKVKSNLENRIASMNMEDRIFEVVIPTEDVIEFKNGKRVDQVVGAVPKPPNSAPSTARSMSASGITTIGFLPPSSRHGDWKWRPHRAPISAPTALEPVKAITCTRGSRTSASPPST